MNGKRLAYLDSAATSQKPKIVLNAMDEYYTHHNGNPGRGVSTLTAEAQEAFEKARKRVAKFIGAKEDEIIFTRNTTESLNLLSYVLPSVLSSDPGRPISISKMEHHSNFVPWQQMALRTKRKLGFIPFKTDEAISDKNLAAPALSSSQPAPPAMLTIAHASNVLGTVNDVRGMANFAHDEWKCPVVVDAAQSAPHMRIDVKNLGCDFLAFSGHKMLGPMGIGVLYMKEEWMERLPPFMSGGGQISKVEDNSSAWADGPAKFEAGTQDVGAAVGLAKAVQYIENIGMDNIRSHEKKLVEKTLGMLSGIKGIEVYGLSSSDNRVGVISFNVNGVHAHDVSTILDRHGVEVRAGHHCAQPLMRELGVASTTRVSFYLYNDEDDINALHDALLDVKKIFGA